VGEVVSPCVGESGRAFSEVERVRAFSEVERVGVRYGFVGGGRACFRPAADSSDGVVERGWGVGVASESAAKSCDGVDERVLMVNN